MNICDKYKLIFFHLPKCAGKSVRDILDINMKDKTNVESGLFQSIVLGFDLISWNNKIYPKKWEEYTKFTIVRNPWDRIVSLYHFRKTENDLYKLFPPSFGMNIMGGDEIGPDDKEWDFKRWVLSSYIKGLTIDDRAKSAVSLKEALKYDSKNLEEAIEHHKFFTEEDNYVNLCRSRDSVPSLSPEGTSNTTGYSLPVRDRIEWWNQTDIIRGWEGEKLVDYILRFEHLEDMWNRMFEELDYEPPKLPKKNVSKHKHYSEYYDDETREFVGHLFKKDIEAFGYEFKRI